MKIKSLYDLQRGLYETFHVFLVEHNWSRQERYIDRMRYEKRKNLRLTMDLLRLMISTILVIKIKGTKEDFDDLMHRLYLLFLAFFEKRNDKVRKMLDDAAEDEQEE